MSPIQSGDETPEKSGRSTEDVYGKLDNFKSRWASLRDQISITEDEEADFQRYIRNIVSEVEQENKEEIAGNFTQLRVLCENIEYRISRLAAVVPKIEMFDMVVPPVSENFRLNQATYFSTLRDQLSSYKKEERERLGGENIDKYIELASKLSQSNDSKSQRRLTSIIRDMESTLQNLRQTDNSELGGKKDTKTSDDSFGQVLKSQEGINVSVNARSAEDFLKDFSEDIEELESRYSDRINYLSRVGNPEIARFEEDLNKLRQGEGFDMYESDRNVLQNKIKQRIEGLKKKLKNISTVNVLLSSGKVSKGLILGQSGDKLTVSMEDGSGQVVVSLGALISYNKPKQVKFSQTKKDTQIEPILVGDPELSESNVVPALTEEGIKEGVISVEETTPVKLGTPNQQQPPAPSTPTQSIEDINKEIDALFAQRAKLQEQVSIDRFEETGIYSSPLEVSSNKTPSVDTKDVGQAPAPVVNQDNQINQPSPVSSNFTEINSNFYREKMVGDLSTENLSTTQKNSQFYSEKMFGSAPVTSEADKVKASSEYYREKMFGNNNLVKDSVQNVQTGKVDIPQSPAVNSFLNNPEYKQAKEKTLETRAKYKELVNQYLVSLEEFHLQENVVSHGIRKFFGSERKPSRQLSLLREECREMALEYAKATSEMNNLEVVKNGKNQLAEKETVAMAKKFLQTLIIQERNIENLAGMENSRRLKAIRVLGAVGGFLGRNKNWVRAGLIGGAAVTGAVLSGGVGIPAILAGAAGGGAMAAKIGIGIGAGMAGNKLVNYNEKRIDRKYESNLEGEGKQFSLDKEDFSTLGKNIDQLYTQKERSKLRNSVVGRSVVVGGTMLAAGNGLDYVPESVQNTVSDVTDRLGKDAMNFITQSPETSAPGSLGSEADVGGGANPPGVEGSGTPPSFPDVGSVNGEATSPVVAEDEPTSADDSSSEGSPTAAEDTASAGPEVAEVEPVIYTVAPNDTLWEIMETKYASTLDGLSTAEKNIALDRLFDEVRSNEGKELFESIGLKSESPDLIGVGEKINIAELGETLKDIVENPEDHKFALTYENSADTPPVDQVSDQSLQSPGPAEVVGSSDKLPDVTFESERELQYRWELEEAANKQEVMATRLENNLAQIQEVNTARDFPINGLEELYKNNYYAGLINANFENAKELINYIVYKLTDLDSHLYDEDDYYPITRDLKYEPIFPIVQDMTIEEIQKIMDGVKEDGQFTEDELNLAPKGVKPEVYLAWLNSMQNFMEEGTAYSPDTTYGEIIIKRLIESKGESDPAVEALEV